jgi:hypothetical protein
VNGRTLISPYTTVRDQTALFLLLRYVGARDSNIAAAEEDIRRWSRGYIRIELAPGRLNVLSIEPPYSDSLEQR